MSAPSESLEARGETNVLQSIEDAYADMVGALEMSEDETDELLGGGSSAATPSITRNPHSLFRVSRRIACCCRLSILQSAP